MLRAILSLFLVGLFSATLVVAQDKDAKDKKEEKKDQPKNPLDETIAGKTIGEWIKLLRTGENPKHRRAALIALYVGDAAGKTALPAVLDAVEKDKEPQVRQEAVMVLGKLGPKTKGALQALVGSLQSDKADEVREAAATALGNDAFVGPAADYAPALGDALIKDSHAGTRIAAATALRNMGENAKPAFPALIEAARNPKEHALVRAASIHVLSRHAKSHPEVLPLLLDILKAPDTPPALREGAIDGVGRTGGGSPEAIAILGQTLTDKNLELRKASAVALSSLGVKAKPAWPSIKDRLRDVMEDSSVRNHLIRLSGALAKSTPEAVTTLTAVALDDKSTENRIAAIQELGELGPALPKESQATLRMIANRDARAAVREAAEKALKRVDG